MLYIWILKIVKHLIPNLSNKIGVINKILKGVINMLLYQVSVSTTHGKMKISHTKTINLKD